MKFKNILLFAAATMSLPLAVIAQSPAPFENPGVTANPAQGEVSTLQRISLTYADQKGVFPNPYQYSIVVTRYGETDTLMSATANTDNNQWNVMHLTLDRTLRDPGTYVITLPTGFVQDWDYKELPGTKWLYTVAGKGDEPGDFKPYENIGVDISPRQGVYPKIGEDFRLNFDYASIGVNPAKMIRMIDDATGVVCGTFSIDYTFTDDHLAVLNQFVLKSDREVTAPGSYTLDFPDGTFYRSSDSEDLGAFKFRYVVSEAGQVYTPDPTYSFVYPSDGTTMRDLDRLVVTFPDFGTARPAVKNDIKVTDSSGNTVATGIALATKDKIGKNQVVVTFQPVISVEGEYTVTIGDGNFIVGENGDTSSKIVLHYTLKQNAYDPEDPNGPYDNRGVRIYPEQGTYKSLNTFFLTFDCEKTGINFANMIKVYNDETGAVFGTCGIDYGANFGREVTVDVLPYMNVPGSYTIVFPHGTFYEYGSDTEPEMPVYKFRYVIDSNGAGVNPVAENAVADPVSGSVVNSLEFINVTFPDFSKIERSHVVDQLNVEIKVVNAAGSVVSEGIVNHNQAGLAPNTMQVKFDPAVKDDGNYDVIFARRVFLLGEEGNRRFNEEFKLNYVIPQSSVESISTDGSEVPVAIYTLQGVKVDSARTPGVYIMVDKNGSSRKTIVR